MNGISDSGSPALARKALPLYLKMLVAGTKVKLRFGGSPRTDGETVWLPHIPYEADERLIAASVGYLIHEAAHITYTDMDLYRGRVEKGSPLFGSLANAVEDPRIEHCTVQEAAGRHRKLERAHNLSVEMGVTDKVSEMDAARLLTIYVVGSGWELVNGYQGLTAANHAAVKARLLSLAGPQLLSQIDALLADFPNLRDTADALALAQRLEDLLKQSAQPQPQPQQQGGGAAGDSDQKGAQPGGEGDGDAESGKPEGPAGQKEDDAGGAPQNGRGAGPSDSDGSGHDGASPSAESQAAQSFSKEATASASPGKPMSEALRKLLEGAVEEAMKALKQSGAATTTTDHIEDLERELLDEGDPAAYDELVESTSGATDEVRRGLLALMGRARSPRMRPTFVGRFRSTKSWQLTVNPLAKVFGRREESLVRDVAVYLLVDASGSMGGEKARVAAQAAIGVCRACEGGRIPVAVSAFGGSTFYTLKTFGGRAAMSPGLGKLPTLPDGGTPLGEAMELAVPELLKRDESRRIMFVISDGQPNNRAHAQAVAEAICPAIEVVGVGIGGHSFAGLLAENITVSKIEDLGAELTQFLRSRVLMKAA